MGSPLGPLLENMLMTSRKEDIIPTLIKSCHLQLETIRR